MEKVQKLIKVLSGAVLLLFAQQGTAAIIDVMNGLMNVPLGQTVTVNVNDTMIGSSMVYGTLNNYGLLKDDTYNSGIVGVLNNHGIILSEQGFSSYAYRGKIINHTDGLIVMSGYVDMYGQQSYFENAGRLIVAKSIGDAGGDDKSYIPFTYIFRGAIKNTGSMLIDRNNGLNVCQLGYGFANGNLVNEGSFEIAGGSLCHFAENPATARVKSTYIQNAGETKINGSFSAHQVTINKGILSGNGNLAGGIFDALSNQVTIAPGSTIGTLNIAPDNGQLACSGCSIAIELSGATTADQLHVNGGFSMNNANLNVQLLDGYVPAPGATFSVITANSINDNGLAPTYNLPILPNGRTWSVQNTGTEVVLTAN